LSIRSTGKRGAKRAASGLALVALAGVMAASVCLALAIGSVGVPIGSLAFAAVHPSAGGFAHTVFWELRLPRVCIAVCVGAGLGVAGAMLQALFRNPLVDPYISGVSAGAALAATLGIAAGASFALVPAAAFGGGLLCAAIVAAIGSGKGPSANLRLVLAGVALSALCSAAVTLVLLRQGPSSELSILSWLAGGIAGHGWSDLSWASGYLAVGLAGAVTLVHTLNALRLGTTAAAGIGLNVDAARWRVLGFASLITAACVSVSGVVGFVGLMVPHGARRLVGGDAVWLLPASAFGGAAVVVIADALARTLTPPAEIPLGVLLAIVGVPFFLIIARKPVEL
jgi:iron complex transport system permease protein